MQNDLTTTTATGTDEQILDAYFLLSTMEVTDRAAWGLAVTAVEAEIARRPHLADEFATLNDELDALADADVAA